ncbi:MAG: hypothetical protein PHY08_02150 [Candidatus Cloacimonetes bacterium]|nr:hypothetical protein [Candidatus Cloacimonadota bacterium]
MSKSIQFFIKKVLHFYKSLSISEILLLLTLHIFIAWNGIQFILNSSHLFYLVDYYSLIKNLNFILESYTNLIPLIAFIILSGIMVFFYLHNLFEIIFAKRYFLKEYQTDNNFSIFTNYSMPAFFHNLWMFFILASIFLVIIVLYILLLIFGIYVKISLLSIIKYTFTYFFFCLFFFNLMLNDFVLPLVIKGYTFSRALKRFYRYLSIHKKKIITYYFFKLCLIFINLALLTITVSLLSPFFIKHNIFLYLPFIDNSYSIFNTLFFFFIAITISLLINSFWIQFLNVLSSIVKYKIFNTYFNRNK